MRFVALLKLLVLGGVLAVAALALWSHVRRHPEDMPWTPLDLTRPIGLFTAAKLARLTDDLPACTTLLDRAGVRHRPLPPVSAGQCGYADGVALEPGGPRSIAWSPAGLGTSCAVAVSLALWEWEVVQPAAIRRLGAPVTRIDHYGSYSCRRLYGRAEGGWSEHATADAIDIAGFRLADGRRITVAGDWAGGDAKAAFLRDVRDGACRLFATTLSPDYNAAHADHLHLDQARRGGMGWGGCR